MLGIILQIDERDQKVNVDFFIKVNLLGIIYEILFKK